LIFFYSNPAVFYSNPAVVVQNLNNIPGPKEEVHMLLIAIGVLVAVALLAFGWGRARRVRKSRALMDHCIEPEVLHELLEPEARVLVFDVRQPLDVLAYSERIPGAKRISPKDVLARPELIPKETDVVVYCTCPGEKTSWEIVQRAQALDYSRLKLLHGGLEAWKAKGYPVEPYKEAFHLDTA
jgi:rhodanese-related sulfurtransferase